MPVKCGLHPLLGVQEATVTSSNTYHPSSCLCMAGSLSAGGVRRSTAPHLFMLCSASRCSKRVVAERTIHLVVHALPYYFQLEKANILGVCSCCLSLSIFKSQFPLIEDLRASEVSAAWTHSTVSTWLYEKGIASFYDVPSLFSCMVT